MLALNVTITKESLEQRICDTCRRKLQKLSQNSEKNNETEENLEVCLVFYVDNNTYHKNHYFSNYMLLKIWNK